MTASQHRPQWPVSPYWLAAAVVFMAALTLLGMGRVPVCTCGTIKLWHGVVNSSENSQHLSDWYTFSHIVHGFIFYYLSGKLMPRASIGQRFLAAVLIESAWEVAENTPMVIERYRAATIALSYFGDSVINSMFDIGAMAAGFYLASRLPVAATVILALAMEAGTAYLIRDNLLLNVVMLVYPMEWIKLWQAAGGG